ncbi:MAG: DUF1828 domain-containing protein [Pseudonocardiaceae bacterium]
MGAEADLILGSYSQWLRSASKVEVLENGVTELTTPFLDRHNDHLQIYAEKKSPDLILLSDDGYIVAELKSSGVDSRGPKREELIGRLLAGHGVVLRGSELQIEASISNLGQRIHNLVQAMISVDDMFMLAQPTVQGIFAEDVSRFLDDHDVRYTPQIKFSGRSGLDHLVDFVIPKSKLAPERVLQVLNTPRRDRVNSLLFAVSDTKPSRGKDVEYYALVNDSQSKVQPEILHALAEYSVKARTWSDRDELINELAA